MCEVLSHRGPDDSGSFCMGGIALGHRRLSVIDIEGSHQPLSTADGSLWIVFNGEIYNFQALRDELVRKGRVFRTKGDAEVVLHLFAEEGERCLGRLRGMFAFAIWDAKKKALFVARDRVGIKPLHYALSDGRLAFASEVKALLECPWVGRELDYEALHDYLTLMYVPAPKTIFKAIRKLPAGHYLVCNQDGASVREYWDIDFSRTTRDSEETVCLKLYDKLSDSVGSELVSDVPLGAFLSGGVDSSSVVALMAAQQKAPVITNAIGFEEKRFDELAYARVVAERFRTDHHEFIVAPSALDILDKLTWIYDEPFGDTSAIPTYYVSQMTRRAVKVALSGDGGDENFAGYPRYRYMAQAMRLQAALPAFLRSGARSIAGAWGGSSAVSMKVRYKLADLYLPAFEAYFKNISVFKEDETGALYAPGLTSRLQGYRASSAFKAIFERCGSDDLVSRMQYLDMKMSLPDQMLVKTDRASAANGLEVRVPLLDHELLEFVATIPSRLKVNGPSGKYIFKKAMARALPPDILYRKKMGFSVPLQAWLRTALKDTVEAELFDPSGIIAELFNTDRVRSLWHMTLHNRLRLFDPADLGQRIWLLFVFSRWHKRFAR